MDTPTPSAHSLVCFPFAGAGASFFQSWSEQLAPAFTVVPMQLPGRERLIAEDPFTSLHEAADHLAQDLLRTHRHTSVALFGHCFLGAVLAYEVARRLEAEPDITLTHLFISAARSPQRRRAYGAAGLNDDDFLDMVKNLTGYTHPAFEIPEIRELLLPTLRADFQMDETYEPRSVQPLNVPITALYATDDTVVAPEQVREWEALTTQAFKAAEVSGGHMYLAQNPQPLLEVLRRAAPAVPA